MTDDEVKKRKRKDIAEDGETVRCPMVLMDGAARDFAATVRHILRPEVPLMHRTGFVQFSDAEKSRREKLYRDHDQSLSDRWKNLTMSPSEAVETIGDERLNAYQRYQKRISSAWRHR